MDPSTHAFAESREAATYTVLSASSSTTASRTPCPCWPR